MTAVPPLYILRHGETEWNALGRLQGRFDSALTDLGRAQAADQHRILARQNLNNFCAISSPQGRAFETAKIAVAGLADPLSTDEALTEIGLGEWAGKDRSEIIAGSGARDGFDLYEMAPGGEGFAALHRRCERFLRELKQPAVLITHGITSRMLRLILSGRPIGALREMGGGQGIVYLLENSEQKRLTLRG